MIPATVRSWFTALNKLSPLTIIVLYSLIGTSWVCSSEVAAGMQASNTLQPHIVSIIKGMLFVMATTLFLFLIFRNYNRQLKASQETFQQAELEIKKLAYYDRETGLPNHNLLLDRLNQVIAFNSRKQNNTAVIYISLTGFKAIVDAHGHKGGLEAVSLIADRLVSTVRRYDTVARIHRDEFVLVLGGTVHEGDVSVILNKLQAIFSEPYNLGKGESLIPACYGIACFPADGVTSESLLQNAHIAMNQARQNGTAFQYYSEALNQKAAERHGIETGLLRAIDDKEFYLCYQPKMDITGMEVTGMEALVRWRRPGKGIIPPDKFIPIAEEIGLITRLGGYVLMEACRQNKAWQDAGLPKLKVAVNLSARQLHDNGFVPLVMQVIDESGLEPHYLELELTESALIGNASDTVCKLLRLKELGIGISVDDFGTGYSSLSYLKHLPIDTIKVDRSFVRDIVNDPDDAAIVDAIVAMAHSLKLNVIAEGVETQEQLEFLRQRKCQQAQGYLFAKPLETLEFEAFLAQSHQQLNAVQLPAAPICPVEQDRAVCSSSSPPETSDACFVDMRVANSRPAEHIGDISIPVVPAHPGDNLTTVLRRFQSDPALVVLPIVENGKVVGIINRSTFLEEHVIGLNGYAFHINHSKKMRDLMMPVRLAFDSGISIREVARVIQAQETDMRIDCICVTRNQAYCGVVDVNRFINAITDINLMLAKSANPLTGLPGNESIQREINERFASAQSFDIAYIDIDNFKPFNDYYGFQRGDVVIKTIAGVIVSAVRSVGLEEGCFCGHIGGDDFILLSEPYLAEQVSARIISELETHLPQLHGATDFSAGYYCAVNRKGEKENFGLLSISIGIVNTLMTPVSSYAELASVSTDVKKAAKKIPGSSIVINRRNRYDHGPDRNDEPSSPLGMMTTGSFSTLCSA